MEHVRETRQRQVILDALRSMHNHPDAAAVYAQVRKVMPRISLATIYRNLDALARSGHIGKVESAGARMHFDGKLAPHCHVQCITCGSIVDVDVNDFAPVIKSVSKATDFEIVEERVAFLGICPRCAENATEETRAAAARKRDRRKRGRK